MNHRERFAAVMDYKNVDRLPVNYFGFWQETLERWMHEGLEAPSKIDETTGMNPDWEAGMWDIHGMVNIYPIAETGDVVIEETDDYVVVRTGLGAVLKHGKKGSSIPQHIEEALKPARKSWEAFKKTMDPDDPRRRPQGWEAIAMSLNRRDRVATFLGGSLFGWPREWMGVEAISYLAYDDPVLYAEIIEYLADFFMKMLRPVLERTKFDFVYLFEDCCFNNGPLFSPDIYRRFYGKQYRRLVEFYHGMGVKYVLLDSDGKVDDLIPCWLDSGIDILFPIEVGTWNADPLELRRRFGTALRMMGGFNKHLIPMGEEAIRRSLEHLKPLTEAGGFIPLPDHRIPPDCSLAQFKKYIAVYKEVLGRENSCV